MPIIGGRLVSLIMLMQVCLPQHLNLDQADMRANNHSLDKQIIGCLFAMHIEHALDFISAPVIQP